MCIRDRVDGGSAGPGAAVLVARPVDLLAARVRGHREGPLDTGRVGEAVEGAHAVHGYGEGRAERRGGDQADAQPGVRAGADPDDHAGDGAEPHPGLGEDPVDGGQQQFPVPAGVDLSGLGDDAVPVVQGDGDGGGGGIHGEQEHTNSLRLRRPADGSRPASRRAPALLVASRG